MCAVESSSKCRNAESSADRRSGLATALIVAAGSPHVNAGDVPATERAPAMPTTAVSGADRNPMQGPAMAHPPAPPLRCPQDGKVDAYPPRSGCDAPHTYPFRGGNDMKAHPSREIAKSFKPWRDASAPVLGARPENAENRSLSVVASFKGVWERSSHMLLSSAYRLRSCISPHPPRPGRLRCLSAAP